MTAPRPARRPLSETHPDLATQADGWDPSTVTAGSDRKLSWRCTLGHRWTASPGHRSRGRGCPVCANKQVLAGFNDLATTHPHLVAEADGWDPATLTAGSNRKVAWRCTNGHRWEATVMSRAKVGTGCAVCSGRRVLAGFNDLATTDPGVAAQADGWDPVTVTAGSHARRAWCCTSGHRWEAVVKARTRLGSGCPVCANRQALAGFNDLSTVRPDLAAEADGWDPTTVPARSNRRMPWRCAQGHRWTTSVSNRRNTGCPACAEYGYDPARPACLYVLESEDHDFYKFGITNLPAERRLTKHARTWGAKLRWSHVASGDVIQRAETTVLRWKRSLGLHDGVESGDGYTETVARSLVGLEELVGVCHEAVELARRDGT